MNLKKYLISLYIMANDYLNGMAYIYKYRKYSFRAQNLKYKEQYQASITRLNHTVEKGLSYIDFRPGFGVKNIEQLVALMDSYSKSYDLNAPFYQTTLDTLYKYIDKNESYGLELTDIKKKILNLPGRPNGKGGILELSSNCYQDFENYNFRDLLLNRHSIRQFSEEPVTEDEIRKAVNLAQNTPSACNRQGWTVKAVLDKGLMQKVLENQNGNNGFGDSISALILVTIDLKYFNADREMFQGYIDGGLFSMNLINSFCYYGLGTIPLSASLTKKQLKNIRGLLNLSQSEVPILFIGVGHYPKLIKTPKSTKSIPNINFY